MTIQTTKTTDLGNDWFVNMHKHVDGSTSMTLRNIERGQRIDVPAESVDRLREIFASASASASEAA